MTKACRTKCWRKCQLQVPGIPRLRLGWGSEPVVSGERGLPQLVGPGLELVVGEWGGGSSGVDYPPCLLLLPSSAVKTALDWGEKPATVVRGLDWGFAYGCTQGHQPSSTVGLCLAGSAPCYGACTEEEVPFSDYPTGTVYSPRAVLTQRRGLILIHLKALPGLAVLLGLGVPDIICLGGNSKKRWGWGSKVSFHGYRWLLVRLAVPEE